MLSAVESFERVRQSAKPLDDGYVQRFSEAAAVGDVLPQGDVYFTKLDAVPSGCKLMEKPEAQLAPGTTQGSRHILDSLEGVAMYVKGAATPLEGPILDVTQERTVTHPEHRHLILAPGVYGVTYQRSYARDAAEELRRQQD